MQVEPVGPPLLAKRVGQVAQRRTVMPGDELVDPRVVAKCIGQVLAHDTGDPAVGVARANGAQQRRGEEQVADRRESDDEDVRGHAES